MGIEATAFAHLLLCFVTDSMPQSGELPVLNLLKWPKNSIFAHTVRLRAAKFSTVTGLEKTHVTADLFASVTCAQQRQKKHICVIFNLDLPIPYW